MRQDEKDFIEFLSRLAEGTYTEEDAGYVKQNFSKTLDPKDFGMEYIPKMFCTNYQIFIETLEQLKNVPGELCTFKSTDDGNKKVLKRCIADHNLHVKIVWYSGCPCATFGHAQYVIIVWTCAVCNDSFKF